MDYSQLVQDALDGNESALKAYAILKDQLALFKGYVEQVEPAAADEAANWDEKTFKHRGFSFTKKVGGKMWDFKSIPEWVELKAKLDNVQAKAKLAYSSYDKGLMAISKDGEVQDLPIVTFKKI